MPFYKKHIYCLYLSLTVIDLLVTCHPMMNVVLVALAVSFLLFSTKAKAVGVYEDIYPVITNLSLLDSVQDCNPDYSPNDTCPLFFGLLSSFSGVYQSSGCIPAVKIALDEINNDSSILPGYSLHYTLKNSQVCSIFI